MVRESLLIPTRSYLLLILGTSSTWWALPQMKSSLRSELQIESAAAATSLSALAVAWVWQGKYSASIGLFLNSSRSALVSLQVMKGSVASSSLEVGRLKVEVGEDPASGSRRSISCSPLVESILLMANCLNSLSSLQSMVIRIDSEWASHTEDLTVSAVPPWTGYGDRTAKTGRSWGHPATSGCSWSWTSRKSRRSQWSRRSPSVWPAACPAVHVFGTTSHIRDKLWWATGCAQSWRHSGRQGLPLSCPPSPPWRSCNHSTSLRRGPLPPSQEGQATLPRDNKEGHAPLQGAHSGVTSIL